MTNTCKLQFFVILLCLAVRKRGRMEDSIPFLDTYLQIFSAKVKLVFISTSVLWLRKLLPYFTLLYYALLILFLNVHIIFFSEPFKRQSHKMVKHTRTIRLQQPTICYSMFDHFVGLVLKWLN